MPTKLKNALAVVLNVLVLPGTGTLITGENRKAGVIQLLLSVVGCGLLIISTNLVARIDQAQMTEAINLYHANPEVMPSLVWHLLFVLGILFLGLLFVFAAWIWGLFTVRWTNKRNTETAKN